MTKVLIPTSLRTVTGGNRELDYQADSVGELLEKMTSEYPDLAKQLLDDEGQLVSFINLFVNDENIRDLGGLSTALDDRDEVLLVPAIAGG